MWYVLVNSRWQGRLVLTNRHWHKARRYDYDRVITYCNNTTYLIDSYLVKWVESK